AAASNARGRNGPQRRNAHQPQHAAHRETGAASPAGAAASGNAGSDRASGSDHAGAGVPVYQRDPACSGGRDSAGHRGVARLESFLRESHDPARRNHGDARLGARDRALAARGETWAKADRRVRGEQWADPAQGAGTLSRARGSSGGKRHRQSGSDGSEGGGSRSGADRGAADSGKDSARSGRARRGGDPIGATIAPRKGAAGLMSSAFENTTVVILAAGLGTRMRSKRAKVLHRAGGLALVEHVVAAAAAVAPRERTIVVTGHQADEVEAILSPYGVGFVRQSGQKGTGHALAACR